MWTVKRAAFYLLVTVIVVIAVFPFYYAVIITSLKSGTALFQIDYWPRTFTLKNYTTVFTQGTFLRNLGNSLFISSVVVLVSLFLGVTAAYALARIRFRGRSLLLFTILSVSMFPQLAVLAGLFELVRTFGLYNSPFALIFSYMIFTLPFTVWVLTTFVRDLPIEIEEAAIVDGATPWIIITRVFLPLMWPALVTTGLLAFIGAWNEFLFALTFTSNNDQRTVPVATAMLSGSSQFEIPWANIMAASVIVTVPLVLLALIFQRCIISGLRRSWRTTRQGVICPAAIRQASFLQPAQQMFLVDIVGEGSKIDKVQCREIGSQFQESALRRQRAGRIPQPCIAGRQQCEYADLRYRGLRIGFRRIPIATLAVECEPEVGHVPIGVVRVELHCSPRQLFTLYGFAEIDAER